MTAKKIALFIDADNISPKFGKQIIETLESRGEIFIRRIYGNWEKTSLHGWNEFILNFSLRPIQQPDYVAGKNATDMSLTIDAMDVLYGGKAEIFALVSNDSDFTPLAIRLREGGMKIIGMGNSQAANSFRTVCDEFIDFDAPAEIEIPVAPKKKSSPPKKISSVQLNLFTEEKTPAPPQVVASSKIVLINEANLQSERDKKLQQIHDVLCETAKVHGDVDGFCSLNDARTDLMNKNFGFTVRDFGYNQLRDFINAFPKCYEVRQDNSGKNFCYRCQKIFDDKFQQIHDVLCETALIHEDSAGWVNLWWACDYIVDKKNLPQEIKKLGKDDLIKFISDAPEFYEITRKGEDFYYRCKTFKQKISGDKFKNIHDVLRTTAQIHGDDKGFVTLSRASNAIGKKNLSIKNLGYGTLGKFISAFPNLYELKENSYRCLTAAPKISDDKFQEIHAVLRETAEVHDDLNGFTDLTHAGQNAHEKNLSIKGSGHGTLSKFVSAFPNLYEVCKVGKNFYYRCL